MNSRLLLLFCLLSSFTAFAQGPPQGMGRPGNTSSVVGKIQGSVIDSLSAAVVEFAAVALTDLKQDKQIDGVVTDEKGGFRFTEVKPGKYQLTITFIGYKTKIIPNIEVTPQKPDVSLGQVMMSTEGLTLNEITVTADAAVIENKIDKIVYNAEKDVSTAGGDAAEVLRRVPLLSVDMEGNVSMRGSENIMILINGRPSTMFAASVADALRTIPADQIKSVEVVTAPTARFDGEGSGGIINIITKRKAAQGVTGSVSASIGNRMNRSNFNLNAAKGRFGINANISGWGSWKRPGFVNFYREDYLNNGGIRTFTQDGDATTQSYGPGGSVSAFYDVNAYNAFSSSLSFRGHGDSRNELVTASFIDPTANISQQYTRSSNSSSLRGGFDWTTDYRRTYKKPEKELVFAIQLSGNQNSNKNVLEQLSSDIFLRRDERNNNFGLNLETTLQLDYVNPIHPKVKLETGIKGVLRTIDSDFSSEAWDYDLGQYITNNARTDIFYYDQDVLSGYLSFTTKLGKNFGLVTGARYEYTLIGGDFKTQPTTFSNNYGNLLPSLILSRNFKNFRSLKLSYTQRIQRPGLRYVNPFVNFNDPRNISFGNPELRPELNDQLELAYNTSIKGVSTNISVFYRHTSDIIESLLQINEEGVSVTSFENIGINKSIGLNLFATWSLKKFWTLRGNLNVNTYDGRSTIPGLDLSRRAIVWGGNINSSFSFPNDYKLEIFGFYRAPRQTLQGFNPSFTMLNIGFQKEFNKKATLGITIVQPFKEYLRFPSQLEGATFFQRSESLIPFRSFGLNFGYRFGKMDFNKMPKQRRNVIRNDDQKDGGGGEEGGRM
jgi:ferric enterobactin receptor